VSAAARDIWGFGDGNQAAGETRMNGKCFCSTSHPAITRGERTRRCCSERARSVLWHHSSVNLVEPRSIALAAAQITRQMPVSNFG
jgi:hypothetical protein